RAAGADCRTRPGTARRTPATPRVAGASALPFGMVALCGGHHQLATLLRSERAYRSACGTQRGVRGRASPSIAALRRRRGRRASYRSRRWPGATAELLSTPSRRHAAVACGASFGSADYAPWIVVEKILAHGEA